MKRLTKKQRHEVYKKALVAALEKGYCSVFLAIADGLNGVNLGEFTEPNRYIDSHWYLPAVGEHNSKVLAILSLCIEETRK